MTDDDFVERRNFNWGLERRLQFIDFRLRWEGRINRADLTSYFGLSVPQASLDLSKYAEMAPGNLEYDKSSKTYIASSTFHPCFPKSSAQRYLAELMATKAGIIEHSSSFIGDAPDMDWAGSPWRSINEHVAEIVIKAIRTKKKIKVTYQSMTSMEETKRILSPHALGNDGFRWHVRAYCHLRGRFSDFNLARILCIEEDEPTDIDPVNDQQWQKMLTLVLAPNPNLTEPQRKVIELDYGMQNGSVTLMCRQALLFYTLRRLGLQTASSQSPASQQIVLSNKDEIQPFIDEISS
jgi:hypothetical protein